MDRAKFAGQEHYEELFLTALGWVVVAAEVHTHGSNLYLTDIAIEPLDTRLLLVGVREVLAIHQAIEANAISEGYTQLEISGYRISGVNPNRSIYFSRRLA